MSSVAEQLPRLHVNINYKEEEEKISTFLKTFKSSSSATEKYLPMIKSIAARETLSITVELDDINSIPEFESLAENIQRHAHRYEDLFYRAINNILEQVIQENPVSFTEPVDIILSQRMELAKQDEDASVNISDMFPVKLLKRYSVYFKPLSSVKPLAVREAKSDQIGKLISIKGMVTRVSDVKPMVVVATYVCSICNFEIFQEVLSESFLPVVECPGKRCVQLKQKGECTLQVRGSRFIRFQEAKIQELTNQVPIGHIPRSMTVQLVNDLARSLQPGDEAVISGIFLPRVYRGYKAIKAGLLTDVYMEVTHVDLAKKQYHQYDFNDENTLNMVYELASQPNTYERLASSIAPEIYGHQDVKKAILLLMVGGVTKNIRDGMKIRGDINICLMGDPGVAKSQLLKWVSRTVPRGVYTTGKGSSGVGLTAAVIKDPITGEMILEGGSLVLADNGVCCIDEFDKMDESDRTSIHEVMEQQTISISKAGINTTLNARVSILAAANPLHSRYNKNKSAAENINLPHALLSRFDLLFLILDGQSSETDFNLAEHILYVHRNRKQPELEFEPLNGEFIRSYIAEARRHEPVVSKELADYVVGAYVQKRREAHENQMSQNSDYTYTQPRTLLAILRMSQALARLRFSDTVEEPDVREALRLMDSARKSLQVGGTSAKWKKTGDAVTGYYMEAKQMRDDVGGDKISIEQLRERLRVAGGFDEATLEEAIIRYEDLNVWARIQDELLFM